MAGWFDWISRGLGEQNPYDEARAYQAQQNAQNNAALSLDPSGNALPPGASTGGGLNVKGPTPITAPGDDPSQPQAHATPKDLGSIMLDLQQYNERNEGFNQAMGTGFAAISQPRDRQMVSQMFNTHLGDPTKIGQMLMNMNSQQQGQNRANVVEAMVNDPTQGPQIARAFGMDWEGLKAGVRADPGLVARIAETWGTADPRVRAGAQVGQGALGGGGGPGGLTPGQLGDIKTGVVSEIGGQGEMERAQIAWDQRHPGQPTPWTRNDSASFNIYQQNQKDLNASVEQARVTHTTVLPTLVDMKNRIQTIKNDPNLDKLLNNPAKRAQAQALLNAPQDMSWPQVISNFVPKFTGLALTQEDLALVSNIRQLNGQEYGAALNTLHQTRPAASEVAAMKTGIGQTQSLNLDPKSYKDQALDSLDDYIKTEIATSYGASQNFNDMPEEYRPYVNPQFVKGGTRNIEGSGSESWADSVNPTAEEAADAQKKLDSGAMTKAQIDRWMRAHGMRAVGYREKLQ